MSLLAQLEAATRPARPRTAAARPADLKAFHSATLKAAAAGKQTEARERYIAAMTGAGWLSESEIERRLGLKKHSANTMLVSMMGDGLIVRSEFKRPSLWALVSEATGKSPGVRMTATAELYRAVLIGGPLSTTQVAAGVGVTLRSADRRLRAFEQQGLVAGHMDGRCHMWRWNA